MTDQEHRLIVTMLATQLALMTELIDTLRRKELLTEADFQSIWKAAISTDEKKKFFFSQVLRLYKGVAASLDVSLGDLSGSG